VEDRLNELEKKVAVLEQAMKPTLRAWKRGSVSLRSARKPGTGGRGQQSVFSRRYEIIETLYVAAAQNLKTPSAIENLKILISKYPKSNRSGCAALYLGQVTNDDEQIKIP
jgi:TolA-binding protein